MSINITPLLCAAALCCASALAHAADAPVTASTIRIAMTPGSEIGALANGQGRAIKNAPYSAEIVKERQQTLGDGNQIVHHSTARAYRDSAGRTREEVLNDKGDVRMAVIKDPVAGVRWTLSPPAKTAIKSSMPAGKQAAFYKAPQDGNMHVLERTVGPDGSAERVVMKRVTPAEDGTQETPEKFTLRLPQKRELDDGALPQMNLLLSGALSDMKWARHATSKTLAPREIDGIKATGQLRSYEIPAGELGNRNPIVVSDETWYAPDLHITLSSKHSDPRTGDSLFRIENLKREEPAPALFAPPPDYAVKDLAALRQGTIDKKAQ